MALDHHTRGDGREFSVVAADKLGISREEVERILIGLFFEQERVAYTLKISWPRVLKTATEAGAAVWRDRFRMKRRAA